MAMPRKSPDRSIPTGSACSNAFPKKACTMRQIGCTIAILFLTILSGAVGEAGRAEEPCPLVPLPKSYRDHGQAWPLGGADRAAIVVGRQATEPERYAAECLQAHLQRRFKRQVAVVVETEVPEAARQVFLLGQRTTNAWLDQLCRDRQIELGATAPGEDGFVIEMLEDGPRQVVVVGGSNPRGVIYGQHALFDLLRPAGDGASIPRVSVRDWPSIAWRGRPHSVLHQHLVPGAMDAYARSRINFIDVRDDPRVKAGLYLPPRKASMGFPAGVPIDRDPVKRVIDEGHRRGMFVYGTVSCAVGEKEFPAVIRTFEELLELGVDGLWISFDDTGAGSNAAEIIRRVLDLGQRHGMSGRKIAITPPAGDYEVIDRPFNRMAAAVPGMEQAQWMFTRVPCAADAAMARQVGIQRLPGWWHNLVEIDGGFLHNGDILCTLRADQKPAYVNIQPLTSGWHRPSYDQLRDAPRHTDTVLLWGVVNGWPEEYEVGALGLWAWNPQGHDWTALRRSIYRYVFGPSQEKNVAEFDDKLTALKALFHLPSWQFEPNHGWPCRLKRPEDRPQALALIDELAELARRIRSQAPAETALDPARLETVYLEPLDTTLVYARKMASLDYPEQSLSDFEDAMYQRIDAADWPAAEKMLTEARNKVLSQLDRIQSELQGLKGIEGYTAFWRKRLGSLDSWKQLAAQRRAAMQSRLTKMLQADPTKLFPYKQATAADLAALFAALDKPPAGTALAELHADDWLASPPRFQGAYAVGPYARDSRTLVAVAYPANIPSQSGDFGEVAAELAVPSFSGHLLLDAFVNDTRVDNRWREYRYMQIWVGDKLVWEEDVAPDRAGREWVSVDVTPLAKPGEKLRLRLRVVEKKPVGNHTSVTFLGPVRLRAAQ
jgi:hypothetical protein